MAVDDEDLLDKAGTVCLVIAVVGALAAFTGNAPTIPMLEVSAKFAMLGIAAIAGVGAIVAFFKNR